MKIIIGQKPITINDIWDVATSDVSIIFSEKVKNQIFRSREIINNITKKGEIAYGINTGFGKLKDRIIPKDKIKELQINLIKSHAVGVGEPFSKEEARAIMFARLVSLAQGYSGVRLEILEKIVELLIKDVIPYIPSQGSVGCSGDLAPLSHIALVLIGEGKVFYKKELMNTRKAFKKAKIKPIKLLEKEGLALTNGTSVMTAIAALNLKKADNLVKMADISGAMSLEVMMGSLKPFDEEIQKARPYKGQMIVSQNIKSLCKASEIIRSHKNCDRLQDSYSLRCIPQVQGAIRDAIEYCKEKIEIEINSATDNPLVFPESGEVKSGGNFHGEPVALAMDFLGIALAELGNISERRTFKMLTEELSNGLPPFLVHGKNIGLNSGLMTLQYTAASLVSENKIYSHPASVDSIPTSANQEDHVSFGTIASNKCRKIIANLEYVLAIELLCATQAADLRKPLKLGKGTSIIFNLIRKESKKITQDRILYEDIEKVKNLIKKESALEKLFRKGIKIF